MVQRFGNTRRSRLIATTGLLCALLASFILAPVRSTSAHSGETHNVYVATIGRDVGKCDQAWLPCRTIMYAIQKGSEGAQVRVAVGEYLFNPKDAALLFSRIIPVTGGYSIRDSFAKQDTLANPTYIAGLPARFRDKLGERGFARVEDRDGLEDQADIAPGATETIYPFELANPTARQNCVSGMAGIFPCRGIDFLGSVALSQFIGNGTPSTDGSNLWGHVDLNTNREYAVFGANRGTAVVDVTDPTAPVVIGTVAGNNSQWREIKVYQFFNQAQNRWNAYAYASTESSSQGMQIIDLNHLSDPTPSVSLANTVTTDFGSSHTVYIKNIDYSTNVALPGKTATLYYNGTRKNGSSQNGGLFRAFDLTNPAVPTLIGAPSGYTYTHDDTSMVITDSRTSACAAGHQASCEIMIAYSENEVELWDVTNPAVPFRISHTPYSGSGYTHSGWYTTDKMHLFIQDELDEEDFGHNTKVRTLDISNLAAPTISATWNGPTAAIDHNGYTIGNKYYMSNYLRGLTILDITDPNNLIERGFFDTYPGSDDAQFDGDWGVYPFLPSGNILLSDISRGLIIVRESESSINEEAVRALDVVSNSPSSVGATTAFTATVSTGTNVQYDWDFGDGSAVTTNGPATASHTYAATGTYTVSVTAHNGINSQTDTVSVTVSAAEQSIDSLDVTNDGPTTLGNATSFSATVGAGTNVQYDWDFGDGSAVTTNGPASASHTYAAAGTYTVSVTAHNSVNSMSDTTSVTVSAAGPSIKQMLPLILSTLEHISQTAMDRHPATAVGGFSGR